jgi:hypothetical protein
MANVTSNIRQGQWETVNDGDQITRSCEQLRWVHDAICVLLHIRKYVSSTKGADGTIVHAYHS